MNTRLMVLGGVLVAFFALALAASNVREPGVETVGSVPQAILEERARLATEHNPYMRKER
jgi:hypothetical protein